MWKMIGEGSLPSLHVRMFTGDTRKVYTCMYKCTLFTMDPGGGTYSLSVLPTVVKGN